MAKGQKKKRSRKTKQPSRLRRVLTGKALRQSLRWGFILSLWGLFAATVVVAYYAWDLPDVSKAMAQRRPPIVVLFARDGSKIATHGEGHGEWLDVDQMAQPLVDAVLAIEDRRFYDHMGVDIFGLVRAMLANVQAGRIVQGGSTLTQQLAKNLFLTPERTLKRKIQEALLAVWLEQNFTKDEILARYLNRVYLGSGAYGVDAAAQRYFGVSARYLTIAEAAMLAGLLKAPTRYSPHNDGPLAQERTDTVLAAMVDAGFLSKEERQSVPTVHVLEPGVGDSERYFVDWVAGTLPELVGDTDADLMVQTTFDAKMQKAAIHALTSVIDAEGAEKQVTQGALVAMSPNGAVRALVGGVSYGDSQYNRATTALRQPGSAFKLFVYAAGFESGMRPTSQQRDSYVILDGWSPKNYDGQFRGTMTLREAFARSTNTIAVKVAERANRQNVIRMAERLGISTPIVEQASVALGTSEVRLLELVAAYATFDNGGRRVLPHGVTAISTIEGQVLYQHNDDGTAPVVSRRVVADMREVMQETVLRGTGRRARLPGKNVSGKTGTSQDFRDAWFIGYTDDVVAGVWIGNDDGTAMKKVTGGTLPATVWRDFMLAHYDIPRSELASLDPVPPRQPAATAPTASKPAAEQQPEKKKKKKGFFKRLFGG